MIILDQKLGCEFWTCYPLPELYSLQGKPSIRPDDVSAMQVAATTAMDMAQYIHKRGIHFLAIEDGIECSRSVSATTRAIRPRGGLIGYQTIWTIRELEL